MFWLSALSDLHTLHPFRSLPRRKIKPFSNIPSPILSTDKTEKKYQVVLVCDFVAVNFQFVRYSKA